VVKKEKDDFLALQGVTAVNCLIKVVYDGLGIKRIDSQFLHFCTGRFDKNSLFR